MADDKRPYYQVFLVRELASRKEKNPNYSLRAFAKFLNIDAATVSRIIRGKKIPSYKTALKIIAAVKGPHARDDRFLDSIHEHKKNRAIGMQAPQASSENTTDPQRDQFTLKIQFQPRNRSMFEEDLRASLRELQKKHSSDSLLSDELHFELEAQSDTTDL